MAGPHIAIVGAGPAGMFAADALTRRHESARVDLIDASPTPYGLVRYGVAPDNAKVKSVTAILAKILAHPRVRFFGNVRYGTDLHWDDLRTTHAATIFATGAPGTRTLGIPGEDLLGSLPAAALVRWYNGYPGHSVELPQQLRQVAVIGAGNVALDVARVLARDPRDLDATDVPAEVIDRLRRHGITDVHIIARRGPVHARFTTGELRELGELAGVDVVVDPADLELDTNAQAVHDESRHARAVLDILRDWAACPPTGAARRVHLRFGRAPVGIVGDGRVEGLLLEGSERPLPVQLVARSVGYVGVALPGLPFDEGAGTVPHASGRVAAEGGYAYVAGWAKRGPSGVIGTNKADAVETVATLLADLAAGRIAADPAGPSLVDLLHGRGVHFVSTEDWLRIDALETAAGQAMGRQRVKVTDHAGMLACRGRRGASGAEPTDAVTTVAAAGPSR